MTNELFNSKPSAGAHTPGHGPPYFPTPVMLERGMTEQGHLTVLVVDDNLTDVWLVNEALDESGIHPALLVASDGEEALTVLDRIERDVLPCPNLMVVDLNLPRGSGFDVLKHIRAGPKCAACPVAIFSSSNAASDKREAARLGASAYIEKPCNLSDLPAVGNRLKELMEQGAVH